MSDKDIQTELSLLSSVYLYLRSDKNIEFFTEISTNKNEKFSIATRKLNDKNEVSFRIIYSIRDAFF